MEAPTQLPPQDDHSSATSIGKDTVYMYGEWQVQPIQRVKLKDGIIPRNKFGNFELWHPRCLPEGCAHINLPGIVQVAKGLQLCFAPAMTGFDMKAGAFYPKIEGVIVEAANAELLHGAYVETMAHQAEKDKERKEKIVLSRWRKFLKYAIRQVQLKNEYGVATPSSEKVVEGAGTDATK